MTRTRTILLLALAAALPASAFAQSQEDETDAHGYDKVRIEQEDKLLVPDDLRDEVWSYLKSRLVDDTEFLRSLDPAFSASWSEELFHDTYFDTPSMELYALQSGVRHRKRENLSNPGDVKSGRELMQIKLNDISANQLERAEIKYDIEHPLERKSALDNHPMLGIVKPAHRAPFEKRLAELGLDARSMRPILTVRDLRRRVYWKKDGKSFMSISFDQASAGIWWASAEFCEIEPELNEIGFTEADPETRRYMESILARVVGDLRERFPRITQDLTPKYNKSVDRIEGSLPFLRLLVRAGLHTSRGLYVVGGALAFAVFVVLQIARRRRESRLRVERSRPPVAASAASAAP